MDESKVDAFNLDFESLDYITKIADEKFDGNRSMALRYIIKEHQDGGKGWKFWQRGDK